VNTIDFSVFNTSVSNEYLHDESNLSLNNNEFKEFKYSSNINNVSTSNPNNTSITNGGATTTQNKNETPAGSNFISIGNSNPPKNNVIANKNNYYIFDENFKISKKPTHSKALGSLNNESKFLNPKQDHSKLNALDANTNFRLPHVKSIESMLSFLIQHFVKNYILELLI
jgi:hypothetical protein